MTFRAGESLSPAISGGLSRCGRPGYRRGLTHPAHHGANVLIDPFEERCQLRLALLDPVKKGLPLARHGGTFHFRVHHLDQVYSFVGSLEALARSGNVAAFQQHFDDCRPCGRGTEPGLLHGVG